MYITPKDARLLLGVKSVRSIYEYVEKGLLAKDPESKRIMIDVQSVYCLRKMRKEKNR